MSDQNSTSAIDSGPAGAVAAQAAFSRLAILHTETADFIKSIADSLAEQGIPADDPPSFGEVVHEPSLLGAPARRGWGGS